MDEEAEVQSVSHNRLDEQPNDGQNAERVQRSAELFFGFSMLTLGLGLVASGIAPYQRPIPAQQLENGEHFYNLTYNELYNGQTVSDIVLIVVSVLVPLAIQLFTVRNTKGLLERHKIFCVYLTAIGITVSLTHFVKIYTGYLRPVFFQGCEPDENYQNCTSGNDREMRRSFPSGHASLSFCGLCVFSFFLEHRYGMSASKVILLNKESGELTMIYRQKSPYSRIINIMCYSPVVVAIFIAASRVHDNMHFPADVVCGALLGGSVAALVHHTWYPNFSSVVETVTNGMSN